MLHRILIPIANTIGNTLIPKYISKWSDYVMLIDICCCAMVSNTSYSLGLKSRSYFMVAELIVHTIIMLGSSRRKSHFLKIQSLREASW